MLHQLLHVWNALCSLLVIISLWRSSGQYSGHSACWDGSPYHHSAPQYVISQSDVFCNHYYEWNHLYKGYTSPNYVLWPNDLVIVAICMIHSFNVEISVLLYTQDVTWTKWHYVFAVISPVPMMMLILLAVKGWPGFLMKVGVIPFPVIFIAIGWWYIHLVIRLGMNFKFCCFTWVLEHIF